MGGNQAEHPARETLAAFGSGKLQPAEAVAVEAHISECEECCETLYGLGNDTFVDLVRQSNALQFDSVDGAGTIGLDEVESATVADLPSELTNHPRYRVLELLGKGGMGNVYKAEHTLMNRAVALKVINRKLVQNALAAERFRREVQSAAQLAHPNIVTAYDAEQAGDMHFLVMEYVPGDNLSDVVKRDGPLDVCRACDYIRQVAQGLQHAHEKGMVHRDIKPHNLMVSARGQVKILDFGLATLAAEMQPNDLSNLDSHRGAPNLTTVGSMMGTPDFISPEQAGEPHAVDIRSDIYSLGCTFYYLLTGRPPFAEGSAMERVQAHADQECEPIETARDDVPTEVATVVRRMMAKDPAKRFQTPAEVAEILAPFVDTQTTAPAKKLQDAPHERSTLSRMSWWPPTIGRLLAGAALAFAVAGVIYVATDNGTLVIESPDDRVEVVISPANSATQDKSGSDPKIRIVDTVTGSKALRLRPGVWRLNLKGNDNDFELDTERFLLKRGEKVIAHVRRRRIQAGPHIRQVWSPGNAFGRVSFDGRYISFPDGTTGDLATYSLDTGKERRVSSTASWESPTEFAYTSVPSPDGKQIASGWSVNAVANQLRLFDVDSGKYKLLYNDTNPVYLEPQAWSRNNEVIVVSLFTDVWQIVLFSKDGTRELLKSLDWRNPGTVDISPDGRFVVYDVRVRRESDDQNIFLLATDGSHEVPLDEHPGIDAYPLWTPDGKGVVFTSDRSGSNGLWYVEVVDGEPGEAQLLVDNTRVRRPLGFTADGSYYFGTLDPAGPPPGDIYVAAIDSQPNSTAVSSPKKLLRRIEGNNTLAAWSPDGRRLAYTSSRGVGHAVIVIREMSSGEEQVLKPDLRWWIYPRNSLPRWSPNGESLLVTGLDFKQRNVVALIDVDTGIADTLLTADLNSEAFRCAVWSPNGKTIYYVHELRDQQFVTRALQVEARDLDTDHVSVLYDRPYKAEDIHSLAISPDGGQLALATSDTISLLPVQGGVPEELIKLGDEENISQQIAIAWTPVGNSILFAKRQGREGYSSDKPEPSQLCKVSVDSRILTVTDLAFNYAAELSLHPKGRQVIFTGPTQNLKTQEIWMIENFLP